MKYFIAIDCGLTKIKVNLFSEKGEKLFEQQEDTPVYHLKIDTFQLRNIVVDLIRKMLCKLQIDAEKIKAISVSGHGNGIYMLGKDGVLQYGYTSMFDGNLEYTPDTDLVFPITNQTSWSGQPLPILAYIKNKEPDIFNQISKILFCKDVIKYFLTGKVVSEYTDVSAAGLLNYRTADYDEELLEIYGLQEYKNLLPELTYSTEVIGNVCYEFAYRSGLSEETAVVGGLFDVNACMLGSGVYKPEKYCIIGGTWGINSAVVECAIEDKNITQCCSYLYPKQYMCIDSGPTSCTNLEWFLKNILSGMDYETANQIVETQPIDEELLYLPYLFKTSDVDKRGSFIGLSAKHTYRDMVRAVYEGIVYEHARRIEKLKRAGVEYDKAVLTGGAANSKVFCQMFADITGLRIETVKQSQTGSLGGVIIAAVATGVYKSLEEAIGKLVQVKEVYIPNKLEVYERKYRLFINEISQEK